MSMVERTSTKQTKKLHVLCATPECVPFVKTGGLADVAGALPRALKRLGTRVSVILPKYSAIPWEYVSKMEHIAEFYVPLSWRYEYCGLEKLRYKGVEYYFIDNEHYFKRDGIYGFFDDGERFAFFSKAICEAINYIGELRCDIIHCNDWQTALVPVFLHEFYHEIPSCRNVRVTFTIHNLKFQGQFGDQMIGDVLGLAGKPNAVRQLYIDRESINFMQAGLCYADRITTVSPSYAGEIQMPFYGEGLDGLLRRRSCIVRGILNGIDVELWNPKNDKLIHSRYSIQDLSGKARNKAHLQQELGLDVDPTRPLIALIGRLTAQKGIGLVTYAMNYLMQRGVQVVVLGTGEKEYEDSFRYFAATYPRQVSACITFDNALSHRIYAGADIFLMPSVFEPCGLSQLISMRYGTIPVVRETGGLRDSVIPYNKYTQEGTGFRFCNINADEMTRILMDACELYWTDKKAWTELQKRAMRANFSWSRAAHEYLRVYLQLCPEYTNIYVKR